MHFSKSVVIIDTYFIFNLKLQYKRLFRVKINVLRSMSLIKAVNAFVIR